MSYDVSFKVQLRDCDAWMEIPYTSDNITWNVRPIIEASTGLPWKNCADNGLCVDVMPKIVEGWNKLGLYPDSYKHLESPNGWGTVAGTRRFFGRLIDNWRHLCEEQPDIAAVAHFWIE